MIKTRFKVGSEKEIPELDDEAEFEDIRKNHNILVKYFNFVTKSLSFSRNFNSSIVEVTFNAFGDPSGLDTQTIQHFLGVVPKYRIILRQTGNGVLEDTPSGWNTSYITMKNRGSEVVTATIMIVRE